MGPIWEGARGKIGVGEYGDDPLSNTAMISKGPVYGAYREKGVYWL